MNLRPSFPPFRNAIGAFTLLELLTVMAIVVVLVSLTVPAFDSIFSENKISQSGQMLYDQLVIARQTAVERNLDVEFRLYKYKDPAVPNNAERVNAFQTFLVDAAGIRKPISKPLRLPSGVTLSIEPSSTGLIGRGVWSSAGVGDPNLPGIGTSYAWTPIVFHGDGETNLPQEPAERAHNFMTIVKSHEANVQPTNYLSIMIESRTGRVRAFRP